MHHLQVFKPYSYRGSNQMSSVLNFICIGHILGLLEFIPAVSFSWSSLGIRKVLIIVWKPQENLEHRSNGRESEASKLSILAGLGQSHAAVPPIGHRRRLVSCDDVFTPWPFSCLVSLGGSFGVPTYSPELLRFDLWLPFRRLNLNSHWPMPPKVISFFHEPWVKSWILRISLCPSISPAEYHLVDLAHLCTLFPPSRWPWTC